MLTERKHYPYEHEFKDVTIRCDRPSEFMSDLNNILDDQDTWIFRGQQDSSWTLLPRVMREDFSIRKIAEAALDDYIERGGIYSKEICEEKRCQNEKWLKRLLDSCVAVERELISDFVKFADRAELKLPRGGFSEFWDPISYSVYSQFSLSERKIQGDHIALAQHHGIPTRLLDFTYSYQTAAFFAAKCENGSSYAHEITEPENMVVWAINKSKLTGRIKTIEHLYSEIGHLARQKGIFLQDSAANESFLSNEGKWMPLEEELVHLTKHRKSIFRFTLPYCQQEALLLYLRKRDVTKLTLMPTYENAAMQALEAIEEFRFTDRNNKE